VRLGLRSKLAADAAGCAAAGGHAPGPAADETVHLGAARRCRRPDADVVDRPVLRKTRRRLLQNRVDRVRFQGSLTASFCQRGLNVNVTAA